MNETASKILIIHSPGRKRTNLAVLLDSILPAVEIHLADNFETGLGLVETKGPDVVLIGPIPFDGTLDAELKILQQQYPQVRIVLLLSHPNEVALSGISTAGSVLYDGFSPRTLLGLFNQFSSESPKPETG
jgi:hypothetical protein